MRLSLLKQIGLLLFSLGIFGICGCGYTFQNSKSNNLMLKEEIYTIFVNHATNDTFKPGIDNLVYNKLMQALVASGGVRIVEKPELADASLNTTVEEASFASIAGASVSSLQPAGVGKNLPTKDFAISAQYRASLTCMFLLVRNPESPKLFRPKKNEKLQSKGYSNVVWTSRLNRYKPFPGANQLDVPGTTSALINDSEFDRALDELAKSMVDEAINSLFAQF